jgi:hypothetical protein
VRKEIWWVGREIFTIYNRSSNSKTSNNQITKKLGQNRFVTSNRKTNGDYD